MSPFVSFNLNTGISFFPFLFFFGWQFNDSIYMCSVTRHILLLCFQNATILLFNFHGGGHPKNLGYMGGGGGKAGKRG